MWLFAIAYVWLVLLWPYIASAVAVGFWLLALRPRLRRKIAYAVLAFIVCMLGCSALAFAMAYAIPLDVAGTPPPDPRNTHLRFLITAGAELCTALALAYIVALPFLRGTQFARNVAGGLNDDG